MLVLKSQWDARYFQIAFQTIFFSYGLFFLHWKADWWLYATYFIVSIIAQVFCEWGFIKAGTATERLPEKIKKSLPSVLISSFGLSLLLKTNNFYVAAFAALAAILSKYLLRINGKHIFNPSALGIVAAIAITGKAWFSPGQWGSSMVILFAVVCLGVIVVTKVQQLDLSLAFIGTFAGLLFARQIIFLHWPLDFFLHSISTGSLLLFSFFMITDPKTTPNHPTARIVWAMLIGVVSFYLTTFKFINGAPIWVLVFAQPLVPLLDYFFKANFFEWRTRLLNVGWA